MQLLTETHATRANIISTLETLAQTTDAESTVLVYYSGHGYQLTSSLFKSYYLLPYAYDLEKLPETGISGSELVDLFREIPAQKLLLLLDCCHAGGLTDISEFELKKSPLPPEAERMFAKGGGRMIIGSSSPDELSYAGKPYSAFTTALIEGFCGKGASKQDGYIRATDLAMYTSRAVSIATGDKQHPVLDIERADNFVLGYYAGGNHKKKELPAEMPGELNGQAEQASVSGNRTITIGGDANDATVVSGDGNVVSVSNVVQKGKYNINIGSLKEAGNLHIGDSKAP